MGEYCVLSWWIFCCISHVTVALVVVFKLCFLGFLVINQDALKSVFTEYGEASQYQIQEVAGKGSYGVVGFVIDTHTSERVAIKKINDVFEHLSDATLILREIKLLRLLRHPDIVEIKHGI